MTVTLDTISEYKTTKTISRAQVKRFMAVGTRWKCFNKHGFKQPLDWLFAGERTVEAHRSYGLDFRCGDGSQYVGEVSSIRWEKGDIYSVGPDVLEFRSSWVVVRYESID